jgi:hypothetical protein
METRPTGHVGLVKHRLCHRGRLSRSVRTEFQGNHAVVVRVKKVSVTPSTGLRECRAEGAWAPGSDSASGPGATRQATR